MTFIAIYKTIYPRTPNSYRRTIAADSLNEATRLAERQAKTGFRLIMLEHDIGAVD